MNQTSKFDLSIIRKGYVGLPNGLRFTKSGFRFFEDHAVADEKVVAARPGYLWDAGKQQNSREQDRFWCCKNITDQPRGAVYKNQTRKY